MPLAAKPAVIQRALSGQILSLTEFYGGKPYSWLVVGCGQNPEYDAQLGVFDLKYDPREYFDLPTDALIEVMKSPQKAIRCIRANNQPILLPLALSRSELHKLSITDDEISRRAKAIAQAHEFRARLGDAIAGRYPPSDPSLYVEEQIYDGFPTRTDQFLMEQFHSATWEERVKLIEQLEDKRFRDLGYRLIFVERPSVLTAEKREEMDLWCNERLNAFGEVPWLTIAGALAELDNSRGEFTEETYLEIRNWLKGLSPRPPWSVTRSSLRHHFYGYTRARDTS